MICRHTPGDPSCGSSGGSSTSSSSSPDPTQFEVDEVEQVGPHLVVRALFPNCASCAYEGKKVLVYFGATLSNALKWRRLDPHFRKPGARLPKDAPSPDARFPTSPEGWTNALAFAASMNPNKG